LPCSRERLADRRKPVPLGEAERRFVHPAFEAPRRLEANQPLRFEVGADEKAVFGDRLNPHRHRSPGHLDAILVADLERAAPAGWLVRPERRFVEHLAALRAGEKMLRATWPALGWSARPRRSAPLARIFKLLVGLARTAAAFRSVD
jgi:hypothetical protein